MSIDIREVGPERDEELVTPIRTAFGLPPSAPHVERLRTTPELDRRIAAFEGDAIIGASASFTFDLTVPGGAFAPVTGLTMVGVLPTHRRRGVLTAMMRKHLDDTRARGISMSALWAAEGPIYGRFGYGIATWKAEIDLARGRTAFLDSVPPYRARLLDENEATAIFASIWDRVRPTTPGFLSRSERWWRGRRTGDPDWLRAGRPPLQRVVIEIEGKPVAYALYRFGATIGHDDPGTPLDIIEVVAETPDATRALFRYLLDIDVVASWRSSLLPPDHELLHLLTDPRRLGLRIADGMWLRLVDVQAALEKRAYRHEGSIVIAVEDPLCPWNQGAYRIANGTVERTEREPDLVMNVDALGAVYLGGTTFSELVRVGRVTERRPGARLVGDALFRGERAPWCPEIF